MSHISDRLGPVTPLDELARHRLERNLLDSLARTPPAAEAPRRRVAPAMLLAAAAAALAVVVGWRVLDRDAPSHSATPLRLVAGATARVVTWADAQIVLEPGAAMTATGDAAHGAVVVLERGAASFEVEPRADRPAFSVVAGPVRVDVVGTSFRVARHGESAEVTVAEGTVRVVRDDEPAELLNAGERWPETRTETETETEAETEADTETETETLTQTPTRTRTQTPTRTRTQTPTRTPPQSQPTPATRFVEATRLERTAPAAALAIYEELSARSDTWGANALFALGRLHADRGARAPARRHLRAYLTRFPTGANVDDARALLRHLDP